MEVTKEEEVGVIINWECCFRCLCVGDSRTLLSAEFEDFLQTFNGLTNVDLKKTLLRRHVFAPKKFHKLANTRQNFRRFEGQKKMTSRKRATECPFETLFDLFNNATSQKNIKKSAPEPQCNLQLVVCSRDWCQSLATHQVPATEFCATQYFCDRCYKEQAAQQQQQHSISNLAQFCALNHKDGFTCPDRIPCMWNGQMCCAHHAKWAETQ